MTDSQNVGIQITGSQNVDIQNEDKKMSILYTYVGTYELTKPNMT
jgi:hypothetical protein